MDALPPSGNAHRPARRPWWWRLLFLALVTGACGILTVAGVVIAAVVAFQQPWFQMWFVSHAQDRRFGEPREPAEEPASPFAGPHPDASRVQSASDLFQPAQLWPVHLRFTRAEFEALGPRRVPAYRNWLRPDGAPILHNPEAPRAGLAGVFGIDQPWSTGHVEFAGLALSNVAVRYKGNGTFVDALRHYKRPFKLDLDRHVDDRRFAGQSTLNLHNLTADRSHLADTLGYEFYRAAGVPAPRTGFARVFVTVEGRWDRRLLGLYALVENPDAGWARAQFGSKDVALYKPVTLELFTDLGDHWVDYDQVYHPKSTPAPAQRRRLVELVRFVSGSDDAEFSRRLGEFFDLDAVARFFACEALISNYDGIFSNGQNFYFWQDPRSGLFGFSPWDLDHSWGEFSWMGSGTDRERADLFHPWVGQNRFLERLYAATPFLDRYRAELARLLDGPFLPERLNARIDELAAIVRPAIAEESKAKLARFERAIADPGPSPTVDDASRHDDDDGDGGRRPIHQLKRFIKARSEHARAQLAGTETGVRLRRSR